MSNRTRSLALLTASAAALAGLTVPTGAQATGTVTQVIDRPNVNHEAVLKAAQLDPHRTSTTPFPGSKRSVLRVERALRAKGLLANRWVDGYFGSSTTTAWVKWENRVHSSSGPARTNGLPSVYELKRLGTNRFDVTRRVRQGSWVSVDGEKVTARTRAMFRKAENLSSNMTITQGVGGASASVGTHRGGGVIDIRTWDTTSTGVTRRVNALRKVGFAAWYRNWPGNQHIHAIAVSDPTIAKASHDNLCQVWQFWKGGSGQSCSSSIAGKNRPWRTWEQYKRTH